MILSRLALLVVSFASIFTILTARPASAVGPTLELDLATTEIRAHNVSPGAEVVIFGGGHSLMDTVTYSQARSVQLIDEDGDGEIQLVIERPVPTLSAWLAVDLQSGEIAAASPGLELPRLSDFPSTSFAASGSGSELLLSVGRGRFLLVRPSVGAWQLAHLVPDTPGSMRVPAAQLSPLDASLAPPDSFQAGDLLAFYDPVSTTIAIHQIQASDIESGTFGQEGE